MAVATITNPENQRSLQITLSGYPNLSVRILNFSNPSNRFLRLSLILDGNTIKTVDIGQVTTYTFTTDSTENDDMFQIIINNSSMSGTWKLESFTDSGYTTQDGADQDYSNTISIYNEGDFTPLFTTYELENVDKNVVVQDKYLNTLITSSTQTLIGGVSDPRIIRGYSKIKAIITNANKMTPQLYADGHHYSMLVQRRPVIPTIIGEYLDVDYEAVADIEQVFDYVYSNGLIGIIATDSRGFQSAKITVPGDIFAEYEEVSIFDIVLARDNVVDALTNLSFGGQMWKKYFGSGTTSAVGVQNAIVAEYRYKETTEAWGAQSWSTITPTVDSNGVISFSDYIDGDLGALGFDQNKSYNVEVRVYDKLSQMIIEGTIDRGQPLVDYYQNGSRQGVAIDELFNPDNSATFQVDGNIDGDNIKTGWSNIDGTVSYSSADAPNYVVSVPTDQLSKIEHGTRIQLDQEADLIAYYKFNSDDFYADSAGSYDLTSLGVSDPASITGKFDTGVDFDGNDAFAGSALPVVPTTAFSIGVWVKTSATGAAQGLFQNYRANTNRAGWRLYINSSNFPVFETGRNTGTVQGTNWQEVVGDINICDGEWHQVIGVWDGAHLRVYVDGRLNNMIAWTFAPGYTLNYTVDRIGCSIITTTNTNFLTGSMDDIFAANQALTEGEIYSLYAMDREIGDGIPRNFLVTDKLATGEVTLWGSTEFVVDNATILATRFSREYMPLGFNIPVGRLLAYKKLNSAGDTIDFTNLPYRRNYKIVANIIANGNIAPQLRFNGDSGNNYAWTRSVSGAADTAATTAAQITAATGTVTTPVNFVAEITNILNQEKAVKVRVWGQGTAGAANAPARAETSGKWANTTSQIIDISVFNSQSGDMEIGSEVFIYEDI